MSFVARESMYGEYLSLETIEKKENNERLLQAKASSVKIGNFRRPAAAIDVFGYHQTSLTPTIQSNSSIETQKKKAINSIPK